MPTMIFGRRKSGNEPASIALDQYGRIPLHYASLHDDVSLATQLIADGQDVNAQDKAGFTPLHFVAQPTSTGAARLLVEHGGDVNLADRHGNGPLWTAVFNSRGEGTIIQLLRENGADPLHANTHGGTPMALSRQIANYDVRQYFVDLP
ncbi:MAG TPA: ankyrin repeat domain-containing protein [Galbitalea sp.]|jgi:ankyrin repeat protein|nr:ankyrin repeat domain-containing protein [Galbitalea sp.]